MPPFQKPFPNKVSAFKIYISSLPASVKNEDLRAMFEGYGRVVECEVFKKNFAFVVSHYSVGMFWDWDNGIPYLRSYTNIGFVFPAYGRGRVRPGRNPWTKSEGNRWKNHFSFHFKKCGTTEHGNHKTLCQKSSSSNASQASPELVPKVWIDFGSRNFKKWRWDCRKFEEVEFRSGVR